MRQGLLALMGFFLAIATVTTLQATPNILCEMIYNNGDPTTGSETETVEFVEKAEATLRDFAFKAQLLGNLEADHITLLPPVKHHLYITLGKGNAKSVMAVPISADDQRYSTGLIVGNEAVVVNCNAN